MNVVPNRAKQTMHDVKCERAVRPLAINRDALSPNNSRCFTPLCLVNDNKYVIISYHAKGQREDVIKKNIIFAEECLQQEYKAQKTVLA